MPSSDAQHTSWKEVSEELNRLHCLMPKYQSEFRSAGRNDIVEDLEWCRFLLMDLKRPPLTLLRKGRPKVTMSCCSVSCSGSGAPLCWLLWSCWPEHAPSLIGTAERSLATARGLNEKRASLSGSACEYRRLLLSAAAVGCISWMILAAISYGLARLLGWRL
jgi:hypothetical protein